MGNIRIKGGVQLGFASVDVPSTKFGKPGTNSINVWFGGDLGRKILSKMQAWEVIAEAKEGETAPMPFKAMDLEDNPNDPGVLLMLRHKLLDNRDNSIKPLIIKYKGRDLEMEKDGSLVEGLNAADGSGVDVMFRQYGWSYGGRNGFSLPLVELDYSLLIRKEAGGGQGDGSFGGSSSAAVEDWSDF